MRFKTEKEWQQAAFNLAFRGLRSQGFVRSARENEWGTECRYRSPADMPGARVCCAVGWLIPDTKYNAVLDNMAVNVKEGTVQCAIMDTLQPITLARADWLLNLQSCHDDARFPIDMEARLRAFAKRHRLTVPDEAQS